MDERDDDVVVEPEKRLDRLARRVLSAALEVHSVLGPGFTENVYEEALALELRSRGIPCARQVALNVEYKGLPVGGGRIDMLVDGELMVELKAVEALADVHVAQVISYLRAFRRPLGLLITFNVRSLRASVREVVLTLQQNPPPLEVSPDPPEP